MQQTAVTFVRYCLVGVLNTLVTLGVIFVCKSILDINPYVANAAGYVAGVTNSFLWNRAWVFHSHGAMTGEALRFLIGFGICYTLQLGLVWLLSHGAFGSAEFPVLGLWTISGYGIATLAGNVLYTICNFAYNRLVTFRSR